MLLQLCRLVLQRHDGVLARGTRLSQAVAVLLTALDADMYSPASEVAQEISTTLRALRVSAGVHGDQLFFSLANDLNPELRVKLETVIGGVTPSSFGTSPPPRISSPLDNAPIEDVLLRR